MIDSITPIRLISLLDVIEEADDVDDVERRVLDSCIAERISAFIRTPSNAVAVLYEWVKSAKQVSLRVGEDKDGRPRTMPIGNIYPVSAVASTDLVYLELDVTDLMKLRDASRITKEWFTTGLRAHPRGGFERDANEQISLCRPPHMDLRAEYPIRLEDAKKGIVATVKLADIFVGADKGSSLKHNLRAGSSLVDRWSHKETAPSVFLMYSAAQKFAGDKYDFNAIKEWLIVADENRVFKGKIADFAARLIKKDVMIKRKGLKPDRLARDRITNNELGKNYAEDIASDRLSLLHLATDAWLYDKKNPRGNEKIPGGNLRKFLFDLGFEDSIKNPKECQVEYLCRVIWNMPSGRHSATEKRAAAKLK
jgi:hypothetical protein